MIIPLFLSVPYIAYAAGITSLNKQNNPAVCHLLYKTTSGLEQFKVSTRSLNGYYDMWPFLVHVILAT
jgi:hypothetical protein